MNFFWHSTVKKTRLPLPAVDFSCLYIRWCAYIDAICTELECLFKKIIRTKMSCIPQGNTGLGNLL